MINRLQVKIKRYEARTSTRVEVVSKQQTLSVFEALAADRRRVALSYLEDHQSLFFPDLADLVAEHEADKDVMLLSAQQAKEIYMSLYHTHIPKLESAGLAHYERDEDYIHCTDRCPPQLGRQSVLNTEGFSIVVDMVEV